MKKPIVKRKRNYLHFIIFFLLIIIAYLFGLVANFQAIQDSQNSNEELAEKVTATPIADKNTVIIVTPTQPKGVILTLPNNGKAANCQPEGAQAVKDSSLLLKEKELSIKTEMTAQFRSCGATCMNSLERLKNICYDLHFHSSGDAYPNCISDSKQSAKDCAASCLQRSRDYIESTKPDYHKQEDQLRKLFNQYCKYI